jgi:hypothetical protein
VIVDALGNLIRFVLLPGQRHDIISFDALMASIHCLALIGDKEFDAGWLRERLRANDMEAIIPLREGTSGYAEHDREKYQVAASRRKLLLQHKSLSTHCHALREDRQMLRRHGQPRRHRPLDEVNLNRP